MWYKKLSVVFPQKNNIDEHIVFESLNNVQSHTLNCHQVNGPNLKM